MLTKLKNKWNSVPLTVKVSTAYTVCSILQRCLSFITLPVFTRILTQEQYGQYTIYSSWLGIFSIILTLNLAYGSFSTAMVKYEDRRDEYISSIQGICVMLSAVFLLIYFPFRSAINRLLELPTALVVVMVLEILFSTSTMLWSGKKRFEFKYKSVVTVTLATAVISVGAALLLVNNSEEKGYARILGYSLTTIAFGGSIFILNQVKGKKLYNKEFWSYAFRFNIPLLAYYFSQVIFNQSDRIMISHINGQDKAAMYGVAYNFAMILSFVLNAINNSYIPWVYEKIKADKMRDNRKVSCYIAILMAVLILAVIWFAPEIITIMAGKSYMDAVWVVAPVAISLLLLFYAQLFINVEFYYEEKKYLVFASIGAAVVNVILNYFAIKRFGFVAAGYTTWFSYIIFAVSNCIAMKKCLAKRKIKDELFDYKALTAIMAVFTVVSFIGVALYSFMIVRIAVAVMVCAVILCNFKKLKALFIKLRK